MTENTSSPPPCDQVPEHSPVVTRTFADFGIEGVPMTSSRKYVYTTCPKCSASRKKSSERCLSVCVAEGWWLCHHCGDSGNLDWGWKSSPVRPLPHRRFCVSPQVGSRSAQEKTLPAERFTLPDESMLLSLDIADTLGCPLKTFLCTLFTRERVEAAMRRYRVGADWRPVCMHWGVERDGQRVNEMECLLSTIFWQVDELGRVHAGKIVQYLPDGHRNREAFPAVDWVHQYPHDYPFYPGVDLSTWELRQCLFGLHLLGNEAKSDAQRAAAESAMEEDGKRNEKENIALGKTDLSDSRREDMDDSRKTIALVESEKSALIGYLCAPRYLWMATGGKGSLKRELVAPLRRRRVLLFPDLDGYEEWTSLLPTLGLPRAHISDFVRKNALPCDGPGADVADILVRRLQARSSQPD